MCEVSDHRARTLGGRNFLQANEGEERERENLLEEEKQREQQTRRGEEKGEEHFVVQNTHGGYLMVG